MNNMWKVSISGMLALFKDPMHPVSWEQVQCKGTVPPKISHHKAAVFGNTVVIFGGINDYEHNKEAYEFDSIKNVWGKLKQTGDVPKPRDDHSLNKVDENSLVIFGGFVSGCRVNECYLAKKNGTTLEWSKLG